MYKVTWISGIKVFIGTDKIDRIGEILLFEGRIIFGHDFSRRDTEEFIQYASTQGLKAVEYATRLVAEYEAGEKS